MIAIAICCAKSNQKARPSSQMPLCPQAFTLQNKPEPQAANLCPRLPCHFITLQWTNLWCLCRTAQPCSILFSPEAAAMTPTGQRFYICLLKNLSLRGASQGLRVGSDVAIARYAFSLISKFVPRWDLRSLENFVSQHTRASGGLKIKGTFDEAMNVFFIKTKEDKKNEASKWGFFVC